MRWLAVLLLLPLLGCGSTTGAGTATQTAARTGPQSAVSPTTPTTPTTPATPATPAIGHIFVINLENKGFTRTWGAHSAAPYLATTLRRKGVLLTRYYGTAHNSQANYVAQVSGQGPNREMQADCKVFSDLVTKRVGALGQRVGHGCVFDAKTPTLMGQLDSSGRTWRGYMEDMDSDCQHPAVGARDNAHRARVGHQYATRHNPFVYFHSVIDRPKYCRSHVVRYGRLATDLKSVRTTRNLSYITPDLCNDAHDAPCVDGRPGGLVTLNAWLRHAVPRILASPAFKKDGVLVITADESDGATTDSTACCGEGASANTAHPGVTGPGGGRIGALVISRWTRPGTTSTTPYNHYSLLGSMERALGLPPLGYARTKGMRFFGADVYNR